MLTNQETKILEEAMRQMVPEFVAFDREKFQQAAARAKQDNDTDPSLYVDNQFGLGRLLVKVCADTKRNGYGVPHIWWWIELQYLLFPKLTPDCWNEVRWWIWAKHRGKRHVVTLWGSQSSGKSSWLALFSIVQLVVWGPDAYVYVAGPVKAHAEDKVVAEIYKLMDKLKESMRSRHTDPITSHVLHSIGLKCDHNKTDAWLETWRGRGLVQYVAIENASAIQGKKSNDHSDELKGIMLLMVDEFIENPYNQLKEGLRNLISNINCFGILACNPDPAKVQHHSLRAFSMPYNETGLTKDKSFGWRTRWGHCYRFSIQNSPNHLLGRTEYPYLLNQGMVERQMELGDEDGFAGQVDAWGFGSGARNAPLDEASIRLAGTFQDVTWTAPTERVAAFDCSFGGADPAGVCILDAGKVLRRAMDGEAYEKTVFSGVEQLTFMADEDLHASAEWIEQMEEIFAYTGGGWPEGERFANVQPGQFMGGAWDMAKKAGEIIMRYNIPPQNVTFDASQRADCADAMMAVIGRKNLRWWYEGSRSIRDEESLTSSGWYYFPFRYEKSKDDGQKEPVLWSHRVSQTSSMIWFMACEMIKAGFLVNGTVLQRGFDELCSRPIEWGRKGQGSGMKDVMSKAKLKKEKQRSPVYGETLAMAMYYGTRFCNLVNLGEPKWLTQTVGRQSGVGFQHIIRARSPRKLSFSLTDGASTQKKTVPSVLTNNMDVLNRLAMRH
jgi:hypothetical protein